MSNSSRTKLEASKAEILQQLDIRAEYEAIGLITPPNSRVRESGWLVAYALGRNDKTPSAAIHVESGCYKDSGGSGQTMSFWDAMANFGPYLNWYEAYRHFAGKTGVKASTRPEQVAVEQVEIVGLPNAINCRGFLRRYPFCTPETLILTGAKLARYPKNSPNPFYVIAWPFYGSNLTDAPHRGYVIQAVDGRELEDARGNRCKRLAIGTGSGLSNYHALSQIIDKKATIAIKVEGYSDMLALQAIIPKEMRNSVIVFTNACGASETFLPTEVSGILKGIHVVIIHDSDVPGQNGAAKWCQAVRPHAKSVRNVVLHGEISEKHGKDLADWLHGEGHGWTQLQDLINSTEEFEPSDETKVLTPAHDIASRLGITVFGMQGKGREVLISDDKGRPQYLDVTKLNELTLRQIIGPEILNAEVNFDAEPNPQKLTVKQIATAIAELSHERVINKSKYRQDGIWRVSDSTLSLVQNGMVAKFNGIELVATKEPIQGEWIYDMGGRSWFDIDFLNATVTQIRSNPQAAIDIIEEATELFSRWDNWKYKTSPELLTSLVSCTFMQNVWPIRPMVSVTGQSNTGKTYFRSTIDGLFGGLSLPVSKTTEAGLRNSIKNSSACVHLDEFEENKSRKPTLELIRTATRGDTIIRSNPNQDTIEIGLKHIVWAMAKEMGLIEAADANRYIVNELLPLEKGRASTLEIPSVYELNQLGQKLIAIGLCFWERAIEIYSELRKISFGGHDRRLVEIYAIPVGLTAAVYGETAEKAAKRIRAALDERSSDTIIDHDETMLIDEINAQDVQLRAGEKRTVGKILEELLQPASGFETTGGELVEALERVGIAIIHSACRVPNKARIFLHPKTICSKLIPKTAANKDVRLILQRIQGADGDDRHRMNAGRLRGVSIPATEMVSFGERNEDNLF